MNGKFRGLVSSSSQWKYGSLVSTNNGKTYILQINNTTIEERYQSWLINTPAFEVLPESVGLFTGLKLKDGTELYEGDKLKYTKHTGYIMEDSILEICWDKEHACFGYKTDTSMFPDIIFPFANHDELQEDVLNHCELIGNIYQNK